MSDVSGHDDETVRRLGELQSRLADLDVRFESAVRRAGDELYARTESALDEVARHIDGVLQRLDALENRLGDGPVATPRPGDRVGIDAEVRARLVDGARPTSPLDTPAVQLLQDEFRRLADSVQTSAKEMIEEAATVREHQAELVATLRERDAAVQREIVDLLVAALDDVLGGVGGRQRKKLAKDLDAAVTTRRTRAIESPTAGPTPPVPDPEAAAQPPAP